MRDIFTPFDTFLKSKTWEQVAVLRFFEVLTELTGAPNV
jgi:hypothetical protein